MNKNDADADADAHKHSRGVADRKGPGASLASELSIDLQQANHYTFHFILSLS